MKKTKILVTIGPSTDSEEKVRELIQTGVNAFRLNFSHGDHETHKKNFNLIRKVAAEEKTIISILQDLSGPKVRIGEIDGKLELKVGDVFKLSKIENKDDPCHLSLSYPEIIDRVNVGDLIYFADGTVRTKVVESDGTTLSLESLVNGVLTSRKGVNFPHINIGVSAITPKDEKDLILGAELGADVVALSFVQDKDDILKAKSIMQTLNFKPLVVAKIETMGAVEDLEEILDECDGVMVARGDLGAELGTHMVPAIQKRIINLANQKHKTCIVATQMLSSMVSAPFPTRAEASDIANAVYDGTDVVMLSDETTIGDYPVEAVQVLVDTIRETEKDYPYYKNYKPHSYDVFAYSAVQLSQYLEHDAIVTFTTSGYSAIHVSKFRPQTPIYAVAHNKDILRKVNMFWGVHPIFTIDESFNTANEILYEFIRKMEKCSDRYGKNSYVVTMGNNIGKQGSTNSIRILDKSSMKEIINLCDSSNLNKS